MSSVVGSEREVGYISLPRLTVSLIVLYVLVTPFANAGELYALFTSRLTSQTDLIGSLWVRYLRELLFVGILISGFTLHVKLNRMPRLPLLAWAIGLLLTLHVALRSMVAGPGDLLLLAGVRWALPALLPFAVFLLPRTTSLRPVARAVIFVSFLHFGMQLVHFFTAPPWFGSNKWGFALRSPGVFLIPNTAAFFSIIVAFYADFASNMRPASRLLLRLLCTVSVLLTASGTGVMVIMVYWLLLLTPRALRKLVYVGTPVFLLLLLLILPVLTGRGPNYVEISGGTRLEIFQEAFEESRLVSLDFGHATNTAALLSGRGAEVTQSTIADSLVASVTLNSGRLGLALLVLIWLSGLLVSIRTSSLSFTLSFVIVTLFSLTTIVTEVRPAGILAIMAMSWSYSCKDEQCT